MTFNNRNNLSNPSAPWGREVEQRIDSLERNASVNSLSVANSLRTIGNTLNTIANQQNILSAQQQRIVEASSIIPRSVNFAKAGGLSTGRHLEFSTSLTKPSWASFAVVGYITTNVIGTLDPDPEGEDASFISGVAHASGSPIPDDIDILAGEEVWYVGPFNMYSTFRNFAVPVGDILYLKQFVFYNNVINGTASASQAITVQWI